MSCRPTSRACFAPHVCICLFVDLSTHFGYAQNQNYTWKGTINFNWDTTTNNWAASPAPGSTWRNPLATGTSFALFTGDAPGTITVTGTIQANRITFFANGYEIALGVGGSLVIPTIPSADAEMEVIVDTGVSATISAAIGGASSNPLIKTGTGTLYLTGANTYSGNTAIQAGVLSLGNGGTSGSLDPSSTVLISSGATLVFDRSDDFTFGNSFAGSTGGSIIQRGTGTVVLTNTGNSGSNISSTTIEAGVLQFNTSTATIPGSGANVLITANGTAAAGYAIDQAFLNRINSSSTGVVAIAVDSSNNLNFNTPGLSNVRFGAIGTATYSGTLTPAGGEFRTGGTGGTLIVSNVLTGSNALSIENGTTILTNTGNNYTNGTIIIGVDATLVLGDSNVVPDSGPVTFQGGALTTGTGTGNSDVVGSLELTSNSTINLGTGSHTLTFSGGISSYTSGSTLTINGWTGSHGSSGTSGQLLFQLGGSVSAANSTYSDFLSNVVFTGGYDPGGLFIGTSSPGLFQLVPIPEPGSILLVSGVLLGSIGSIRRHHRLPAV